MAWTRRVVERPSTWGVTVRHELLRRDPAATTLAVLLPGDRYPCDAPLLAYARQVCLQRGCDVLAVEYGHRAARGALGQDGIAQLAVESAAAVEIALQPHHERVLVVAKSLGTEVATRIGAAWGQRPAVFAFLTPLTHVVPFMLTHGGLLVVGDHDPAFGPTARGLVAGVPGLAVRVIPGADHQLLIADDWRASLTALEATCAGLVDLLAAAGV